MGNWKCELRSRKRTAGLLGYDRHRWPWLFTIFAWFGSVGWHFLKLKLAKEGNRFDAVPIIRKASTDMLNSSIKPRKFVAKVNLPTNSDLIQNIKTVFFFFFIIRNDWTALVRRALYKARTTFQRIYFVELELIRRKWFVAKERQNWALFKNEYVENWCWIDTRFEQYDDQEREVADSAF